MLSIILPTYNEAANIPELLKRIAAALTGKSYEVIVVDDDSLDKTWHVAEQLKKQYPLTVIHRVGRRGLSSAVVEGFAKAKGDIFLVMDSDLQHDPALIQKLTEALNNDADIAVASRYMKGGSVGEWITGRRIISKVATFLARKVPPVEVSDPMSGFFAIKRSVYQPIINKLRPAGFKILLEILAFLPRSTKTAEVPLVFKMREHGESKLNLFVELLFLWQLVRIVFHRLQKLFFVAATILILLFILPRVVRLIPLYTNAEIRGRVHQTISLLAEAQGWLISDLALQAINDDNIRVIHRVHHRGRDEETCLDVALDSAQAAPCAD